MRQLSALLLPIFLLGLASAAEAQSVAQPNANLDGRVRTLEEGVSAHRLELDGIYDMIGNLSADLKCDTGGFNYISPKNSGLAFLVACVKIEPYLEGFRLTLHVGNPYSMAFSGLSASVHYGDSVNTALKHSIELTSPATLTPGQWTTVFATINPVDAKALRSIYMSDFKLTTAAPR